MPTAQQAFEVGFDLNLVGVYFDSATVLAAIQPDATGELADRVTQQVSALKAHARQARKHVKTVHTALSEAGLQIPDAPETPEGYGQWVTACSEPFYGTLDGEAIRGYLAGWYLGQWTLAANLSAVALYLADAAPEHAYLGEVLDSYASTLSEAAAGLEGAAADAPEGLAEAIKAAHAQMQVPGEGAPLERAGALQEALEALDAGSRAIQAQLAT